MDWEYEIIKDGTAVKLSRYTGTASSVITPEIINGLPVTVLGNCAFLNNDSVRMVCISSSIHTVEDGSGIRGTGAFRNCKNLQTVVLSQRMRRVADYMFYGAAYGQDQPLTVHFQGVEEIGSFAFACCNNIVHLQLSETVTTIGTGAFYQARRLATMDMPGVCIIRADAFTETIFEENYEKLWEQGDFTGVVYAGKVAYLYMGSTTKYMPEDTCLIIADGTLGISEFLFTNHFVSTISCRKRLREIRIPRTVKYIPEGLLEGFTKAVLTRW